MGRVLFMYPIFLRHMRDVHGVVAWRRITPKILFPDVQWCAERSTPSSSILAVTNCLYISFLPPFFIILKKLVSDGYTLAMRPPYYTFIKTNIFLGWSENSKKFEWARCWSYLLWNCTNDFSILSSSLANVLIYLSFYS